MGVCPTHLLPCACAVGLAGSVHSRLVLPEVHQGGGQTPKVGHVVVQKLGSVVHFLVITTVADLEHKGGHNK